MREAGGWMLRRGAGGGQRVSAASQVAEDAEIGFAEAEMAAMGQKPLFMIRPDDGELDAALDRRGYAVKDPVAVLASTPDALEPARAGRSVVVSDGILAVQAEIWAQGGIGPERLAVMGRAACPTRTLLGRDGDVPAATAFMGIHEGIAMLHGLEVLPAHRGKGLGKLMMAGAARVAQEAGAREIAVLVVRDNVGASALYNSLGMGERTGYHYRTAPDPKGE
ncbi:GNAT family N-acetyltransferase [Algicella marina]|uniref:GNAT family N-acetyltransferase n=2 Tax=Algicella marina TaxID=2683284 RepID=A0A6P1T6N8_9RHOB|nr:GNAT family N-acetyltransferase [Algicella marina]